MFEVKCQLSEKGVTRIDLSGSDYFKIFFEPEKKFPDLEKEVRRWFEAYLDGELQRPLPPHVMTGVSLFTRQVVQKMHLIPPGKTWSYKDVAVRLGKPLASRAVGSACGRNPLPLFYPCHRVIAHDGTIGGFGSGLELKKVLLCHEGVHF